jgi:hypothetical protein
MGGDWIGEAGGVVIFFTCGTDADRLRLSVMTLFFDWLDSFDADFPSRFLAANCFLALLVCCESRLLDCAICLDCLLADTEEGLRFRLLLGGGCFLFPSF